jgi:multimeric flavodoxin WrbA
MKVCVLIGSPREKGNTAAILRPFCAELEQAGHQVHSIGLYERHIEGCRACRVCQENWQATDCAIDDDAAAIFPAVLQSDLLVLATPIYSWYCTAPMKALLDRMVYVMNKYYGEKKGPALWEGKAVATVVTCGYPPEKGADLWDTGLSRYCRHSRLRYLGMYAEHDHGYKAEFMDEEKEMRARDFARKVLEEMR